MERSKIKTLLREQLLKEDHRDIEDLKKITDAIYDDMISSMGFSISSLAPELNNQLSLEEGNNTLFKNVKKAEELFRATLNHSLIIGSSSYLFDNLNLGEDVNGFLKTYSNEYHLIISIEPYKEGDTEIGYFSPPNNDLGAAKIVIKWPSNMKSLMLISFLELIKEKYGINDGKDILDISKFRGLDVIDHMIKYDYHKAFEKAIMEDMFSQSEDFYQEVFKNALTERSNRDKKRSVGQEIFDGLFHELQHAFDDYRSKGKYTHVDPEKTDKVYGDNKADKEQRGKEKPYTTYLKLPHEVWARLNQTISYLENRGIFQEEDFNKVKEEFENTMEGYDLLGDKIKKRILKTLYKYWDDEQRSDNNKE